MRERCHAAERARRERANERSILATSRTGGGDHKRDAPRSRARDNRRWTMLGLSLVPLSLSLSAMRERGCRTIIDVRQSKDLSFRSGLGAPLTTRARRAAPRRLPRRRGISCESRSLIDIFFLHAARLLVIAVSARFARVAKGYSSCNEPRIDCY